MMDQSPFFPPYDKGKSKLMQCIDTGAPVFSMDTGVHGEKTFFSCGYEYFCSNLYKSNRYRNVYEVLQFGKPTKIYLDFDQSREECTEEKFNESFGAFMEACMGSLGEAFPELNPEEIPCVTLDSSSDTKLSRHAIIQVTLESVLAVKEFVEWVLGRCPCPSVDTSVYSRNRSFRLLYSSKLGKGTPLRVLGRGDAEPYSPTHVFMSMIQAVAPRGYQGVLCSDPGVRIVRTFSSRTNKKRAVRDWDAVAATAVDPEDVPPGVVSYIRDIGAVLRSTRLEGDFMSFIVGGVRCPHIRGMHKNNNAYFTLHNKTLMGWWRCADPDCPRIVYDKINLNYVEL